MADEKSIDEYSKESALMEQRNKTYILKYIHRKTFYIVCVITFLVNAYKALNVLSFNQIGQLFVTQDGLGALLLLVFEMLYNGVVFGLIISFTIWLKNKIFKPKST
jgi:hypothetical protein